MPLDKKYLTKCLWTEEPDVQQNVCRLNVGQIVDRPKNVDRVTSLQTEKFFLYFSPSREDRLVIHHNTLWLSYFLAHSVIGLMPW